MQYHRGYVYRVTNTVDNKHYIGSTTDFDKRRQKHFSNSHCEDLKKDIARLGKENFHMEIVTCVDYYDKDYLRTCEGDMLMQYRNNGLHCYNKRVAGHGKDSSSEWKKEQQRNTITCGCGATTNRATLSYHENSESHLNWIANTPGAMNRTSPRAHVQREKLRQAYENQAHITKIRSMLECMTISSEQPSPSTQVPQQHTVVCH
eukprot:TRINITY_DN5271_c0_g1_i1.p1 TRINITY_DN5271_c0_g1~~TRINITY_DN5271_c0_g1_i1.p1  ORF type:complete len:204 (+),score=48.90 TRINITY_DN5271_c0_g1_i1:426-1037(+)